MEDAEMYDDNLLFVFPELPDEAVLALERFIGDFHGAFQSHYFAQLHRCYPQRAQRLDDDQLPLPIDDPPF
jgi:hypothetical protein